jgi:hypothetical protein
VPVPTPPLAPEPVLAPAPTDSAHVGLAWGLSSDYTNQIYYEETFDSTAVTGRVQNRDARARALAFAVARLDAARGRWSFTAVNDAGLGPTAWREAFDARGAARLDDRFSAGVDGGFDARRDETFDARREDRRATGGASLRYRSADLADGARLYGRIEGLRSAEGSLALFPDYDWRQAGLELDHFGLGGHVGVGYAYGTRAFPDTSSRDYREHDVTIDAALWKGGALRLETRGDVARRVAWRDSAIGDRFTSGDAQIALWFTTRPTFEWAPLARVRAQNFDAPDPTFFDVWIYRYGLAGRLLPDAARRYEVRPEVELLRTPRFGGLPASTPWRTRSTTSTRSPPSSSRSAHGGGRGSRSRRATAGTPTTRTGA